MTDGRKLRIAVASAGRFHVLDLARELAALGHDVRFYSFVPRKRAIRFGLPAECHVGLLPYVAALILLERIAPKFLPRFVQRLHHTILDRVVTALLQPCDVFIGMSGLYVGAALKARRRYGAKIFIERGSRHILSQRDILAAIPGAGMPQPSTIALELAGYELADKVVVPSLHAEQSFIDQGVPRQKLFRNAYGVELADFSLSDGAGPVERTGDALFVGQWSLRKGVDLLVEAVRALPGTRLLHAGTLIDAPFPADPQFVHLGPVDQQRLAELYRRAAVLVLPSREDGFGLVLIQALACGLPILCSDRTGGEDLKVMIARPEAISIVPHDDIAALTAALGEALRRAPQLAGADLLGDQGRELLTWRAYAKRYEAALYSALGEEQRPG